MKSLAIVIVLGLSAFSADATAKVATPSPTERCPSKWGANP